MSSVDWVFVLDDKPRFVFHDMNSFVFRRRSQMGRGVYVNQVSETFKPFCHDLDLLHLISGPQHEYMSIETNF